LEWENLPSMPPPAEPVAHRFSMRWLLADEFLASIPPGPGPASGSLGLRGFFSRDSLPPPPPPGEAEPRPRSVLRWIFTDEELIDPMPSGGIHHSPPAE